MLGGLRARVDEEPILVVPAFQDVEHAQRELAERGAVFGVSVLRFDWLFREIARRAGHARAGRLRRPARADRRGGGAPRRPRAARRVGGAARLRARGGALRRRAGALDGRAGALHAGAARLGRRRAAAAATRRRSPRSTAATATGSRPPGWRTRSCSPGARSTRCARDPAALGRHAGVRLRLRRLRRGSSSTRSTRSPNRCGADVTVSLPYEAGRAAFKAVADAAPGAARPRRRRSASLPPLDDHYAAESRAALHHVERSLFEDEARARSTRGGAVEFHSAAGQRAEIELAGARVLDLLRAGIEPGDIAVVLRRPDDYASLLEQVFGAYDIPFSIDRSVPLGHTGLGRGLLALVRCAADPDAPADDLLAWLRTPGLLRAARAGRPARGRGAPGRARTGAAEARALWEASTGSSTTSTGCARRAAARPLLAELERQLARLFAAPYKRQAARAARPRAGRPARVRRGAARRSPSCARWWRPTRARGWAPSACWRCCASCACTWASRPSPTACRSPSPRRSARAASRRCSSAGSRRASSRPARRPSRSCPTRTGARSRPRSGLRLPLREDRLDRERYLFYVCCSRAERLLVLSSRSSDEEGNPQRAVVLRRGRARPAGAGRARVAGARSPTSPGRPRRAPTAAELERALAAIGPRRSRGAARPPHRRAGAGAAGARATPSRRGALENFADCPVKWLVQNVLRPDELVPDPEQMVRGALRARGAAAHLRAPARGDRRRGA